MSERDDFYVGYFPLPRAHKRFLQVALPLVVFLMVFSAAGIALKQRDPGAGVWQTGEASTWTGVVRLDPYPVLHSTGSDDSNVYLLVRMGKLGAHDAAAPFDNRPVTIRGRQLERDGRRMIELDDGPGSDPAITLATGTAPQPIPAPTDLGPATLHGEILDAKCYLGAMKPGDGKAHKACATNCIASGIPPMLYARAPDGSRTYTLLTNESGAPIIDSLLPFIGEPVTISGRLEQRPIGRVLRVDANSISRP